MNLNSILGFCVCFGLFSSVVCETNFPSPAPTADLRCGGTLKEAEGHVTYKTFDIVDPNERCVWTIRSTLGKSAHITMDRIDTPHSVTVVGLGIGGVFNEWSPTQSGDSHFLENTNVVVLTFHSSANYTNLGRGITFSYKIFTNGTNQAANYSSEDVIQASSLGHVPYPSGYRTEYGIYDLSVFVFVPLLNKFDERNEIAVTYVEKNVVGVKDYISVYTLRNSWICLGSIENTQQLELIRSKDIIMLVFESDGSFTGTGFQFTYSQSSSGNCV